MKITNRIVNNFNPIFLNCSFCLVPFRRMMSLSNEPRLGIFFLRNTRFSVTISRTAVFTIPPSVRCSKMSEKMLSVYVYWEINYYDTKGHLIQLNTINNTRTYIDLN